MESKQDNGIIINRVDLFDSFDSFETKFKVYCEYTNQVFIKRSSHPLKIERVLGPTQQEKEVIQKKLEYNDIHYECIHKGHVRKNPNKSGVRFDIHSKKIDCNSTLRINFDKKSQKLKITQLDTEHNHPVNSDLYQQYSLNRKPPETELTQMVNLIKNVGANSAKIVRKYNNDNGKSLKSKDVWNHKTKLEKISLNPNDRLTQILDEISKNQNNTVITKKSIDGILENAFIMTEKQK